LLDALGIQRAHVAGHSWGAAISMQLAADAPERVGSLVLLDPLPPAGARRCGREILYPSTWHQIWTSLGERSVAELSLADRI
jgi:pimeloyl-ACP methyl ester carboxylesterase